MRWPCGTGRVVMGELKWGQSMTVQEKREKIINLLDHWEDFFDQSYSESSLTGEEGIGMSFVSSMSRYPSVVELQRCMGLCRKMARGHYNHLAGTFGAEWRTVTRPVQRRDALGRTVTEPGRVRERVLPTWLAKEVLERGCTERGCGCGLSRMTCRAVDFVAGCWDVKVALELPPALTRKLRALSDSDGWTEAA